MLAIITEDVEANRNRETERNTPHPLHSPNEPLLINDYIDIMIPCVDTRETVEFR